jgi:hypothetical protein
MFITDIIAHRYTLPVEIDAEEVYLGSLMMITDRSLLLSRGTVPGVRFFV